ncbi:MAG TPA: hypothetical protein DEP20_01080 [Fusobacteria bacterium]|nr:hypothetical protein [Fusobacteriota bacterium]|tara:strand:- start:2473 stop:3726 length:1254 start_codon:yes stop_codon:yes gene_type:complete
MKLIILLFFIFNSVSFANKASKEIGMFYDYNMSSFANSKNMISVSNASSLIFNKFQSDNFFVRCMLYNLSSTVAHLSGILFHESGHRGAIRELDGKVKYFGLVKPKSYLTSSLISLIPGAFFPVSGLTIGWVPGNSKGSDYWLDNYLLVNVAGNSTTNYCLEESVLDAFGDDIDIHKLNFMKINVSEFMGYAIADHYFGNGAGDFDKWQRHLKARYYSHFIEGDFDWNRIDDINFINLKEVVYSSIAFYSLNPIVWMFAKGMFNYLIFGEENVEWFYLSINRVKYMPFLKNELTPFGLEYSLVNVINYLDKSFLITFAFTKDPLSNLLYRLDFRSNRLIKNDNLVLDLRAAISRQDAIESHNDLNNLRMGYIFGFNLKTKIKCFNIHFDYYYKNRSFFPALPYLKGNYFVFGVSFDG